MFKWAFGILLLILILSGYSNKEKVVSYPFPKLEFFPPMPSAANNPVSKEGALLGRYLFYDSILSIDNKMSCASCHIQSKAFSASPEALSKGRYEKLRRNTLPLFNLAWYNAMFWDGRAATVEEQVFHPLRDKNEMNLDWNEAAKRVSKNPFYKQQFKMVFHTTKIDSVHITKAIAQFLRTLLSYNSKYDRVLTGKDTFSADEYQGFVLMNDMTMGDCMHCHTTDTDALGTIGKFSNTGLDKVNNPHEYIDKGLGAVTNKMSDNGKFKIPSLRNLVYTAPYMHDGRFKTLEEVVDFYSSGVHVSANVDSKMQYAHQGGVSLTELEKKQIVAFLKTLSDSVFVSNPEYSNPYHKR